MARRGGSAAEALPITYAPAEFVPSRVLPASKAVSLSLIKVPKFVAESWRSSPPDTTAGVLTEKDGKQTLIVRDPETGGALHLDSIWLSNDRSVVLQRNGKHLLDVIGEISSRTNFQPKLDTRYQQVLHERHIAEDMNKSAFPAEVEEQ